MSTSQFTEHLGLQLPKSTDYYSVEVANSNNALIDEAIHGIENEIKDLTKNTETSLKQAISDLVDGAPEHLDTLREFYEWIQGEGGLLEGLNKSIAEKVTIVAYNKYLETHESAHDGLMTSLENHSEQITSLNSKISSIESALADFSDIKFDSFTTDANQSIYQLNCDLNNLDGYVNNIDSRVHSLESDTEGIQDYLANLSSCVHISGHIAQYDTDGITFDNYKILYDLIVYTFTDTILTFSLDKNSRIPIYIGKDTNNKVIITDDVSSISNSKTICIIKSKESIDGTYEPVITGGIGTIPSIAYLMKKIEEEKKKNDDNFLEKTASSIVTISELVEGVWDSTPCYLKADIEPSQNVIVPDVGVTIGEKYILDFSSNIYFANKNVGPAGGYIEDGGPICIYLENADLYLVSVYKFSILTNEKRISPGSKFIIEIIDDNTDYNINYIKNYWHIPEESNVMLFNPIDKIS